ncbi:MULTISPECIES: dTDP-glucose 4,6-dehydratase [Streptomyces]|uniref:dTDP-glucose 4,6-dehydratase n=1 Tax=Streptomyces TaxID=1883 RepID=UPI001F3FAFA3|nr:MULTISPECIES: dTDP-glucose 4,6-dehydratase [Streptomyces]MCF3170415.1 dTDP-glucose 4,6-dehydratase [Streptomyces violaceoruber]MDW4902445.1 dTDP-glucose 4,6-dehydratase [Streptomyces californicus]
MNRPPSEPRSRLGADRPLDVLVTGGAGFIGSCFTRLLLGPDSPLPVASVTVLDALTYAGNRENLAPVADDPRLVFVHGDIRDARLVGELMPGRDAVVHFAAESHVDRSIAGAAEFLSTNVLGTGTLLDGALRHSVGTFLHVSTDEVYGSVPRGSTDEEHPLRPTSPYASSKASSDLVALSYQRTHGLDVRVTRCSNNYGPYQFPEKVIPLFTTRLLDGLDVPLYGDGLHVRDWLHVEDHCRALCAVLADGAPGEVYNIGSGTELTNLELTTRLLDACGADRNRIRQVADRKAHDLRYSVDDSKIRARLGWKPQRSAEEGLAATVAWYRENRAWWEPLKLRAQLPSR